jgi:hypothetical protein
VYEQPQDRVFIEGFWKAVEAYTGDRPDTCPWHSFRDPLVIDVVNGYSYFESGQLREYWGDDPPYILSEAMRHYHTTMERVRSKQMELEQKKREKASGRR